jgi:ketosteroid isomerase-like protein
MLRSSRCELHRAEEAVTMTRSRNEDVVRNFYAAFRSGDMDALSRLMARDIVWNSPGNSRISGHYEGQDAVFKLFAVCGEITEGGSLSVDLETLKTVGENTVITTHRVLAARQDGAKLDVHETETVTVENGHITRVDESVDDEDASDAFWV